MLQSRQGRRTGGVGRAEHVLRELVEQPIGPDQLHSLLFGLSQQLLGELPLIQFSNHGGIGSSAAVLLAVKEPLGSLLPGFATHWMVAYAIAAATVYATYRATNAKPEKPAEREVPAGTKTDELAAGESQPQLGWALAGVAFVLGGAILAGRNWGRRMQPVVPYTMLLPHGGSPPGPWMPSWRDNLLANEGATAMGRNTMCQFHFEIPVDDDRLVR